MTLLGVKKLITEGKVTSEDVIQSLIKVNEKYKHLNFQITETYNYIKHKAAHNPYVLPVAIKDNFHIKDIRTTAGSKMMENYIAPITSTIVDRLEKNNMFSLFKANMDEYAMGSTGASSAYGVTFSPYKNNHGEHFFPGGSSSGSAAAVACGAALAATGTDTGGSIRQPASWSGIVGFKPTYGVLSRYGIVEMAHSLDCPGLLTKDVSDCEYMFNCIVGSDSRDGTSVNLKPSTTNKKSICVIRNFNFHDSTVERYMREAINFFHRSGYEIKYIDVPHVELMLSAYYVINTIESSSNLSKFTKIIYDKSSQLTEEEFRSQKFGLEVKTRIMIGNFITSREHFEVYYAQTQRLIGEVWKKMEPTLKEVDAILLPTAGSAMTLDDFSNSSNVDIYKQDIYTCVGNLLGLPAISIPVGFFDNNSPVGLQLMGNPLDDIKLLHLGKLLESHFQFRGKI